MPAEEARARLVTEVSALGHELDWLAAASETGPVYWREIEVVVGELQRHELTLLSEIAQAIAEP